MSSNNGNIDRHDDIWNQVTIIRGKVAAAEKKRDGRMMAVEKRQHSAESIAKAKLDNSTEGGKHKQNTREFGLLVSKARYARGYKTQKDLALAVREKVDNIKNIESGKGKYDGRLVGKLKTFLKLHTFK